MMYENTEFGPSPLYRNSVWDIEDLMHKYKTEVVPLIMKQGWAVDEMMDGYPQDSLEDDIWKGYEKWATETIEAEKQATFEGCDERDFY